MNPRKLLTFILFSGGLVFLVHLWKGWPIDDQRMIYVAIVGAFIASITSN